MKTDALIDALAQGIQPGRMQPNWRGLVAAAIAGLLLAGVLGALLYGVRPDLRAAIDAVLMKSGFCLAAAAVLAPLAYWLAQPNTGVGRWAWPALAMVVLSLTGAALALAFTPPGARMDAWLAGGVPECLERVPVLALPVAFALFAAARSLAPTRLTLAGAALGGLAGAIAAIAYSWICRVDSAPYVATWYLASIALCAGLGALAGRWCLRW